MCVYVYACIHYTPALPRTFALMCLPCCTRPHLQHLHLRSKVPAIVCAQLCMFVCMFTLRIRGWFSINVTGDSLTACSVQLYAAAKQNELKILRRLASPAVGFAYLQAFTLNDNLRAHMYA